MKIWQKSKSPNQNPWLNHWTTDQAAERLPSRLESLSIHGIILFFMIGIILFYGFADMDTPLWNYIYYVWNKAEDFAAFICIWILAPKKFKSLIVPVVVFSAIRLIWEIVALLCGQNVNSIMIVDYLFFLSLGILIWKYFVRWLDHV